MSIRSLATISANTSHEEELTLYTQSKITTLYEDDAEIGDILRWLKISENIIKYTVKTDAQHLEDNIIQRMSRLKKYT